MKKHLIFFPFLAISVSLFAKAAPVDHVNMMIGTTGGLRSEYGGTTPAISAPFGMTQWSPVTRINMISKTMYNYADTVLLGFMATHQPAIWMGDYGFFTLVPQVDSLRIQPERRAVKLDHSQEIATPYYYRISTLDYGKRITTELTATSRCSFFKIKYPQNGTALLMIEASREKDGGGIEIIPEKNEIRVFNKERHDSHLGPRLYNFKGCYVLKFSKPFKAYGTWASTEVYKNRKTEIGQHVGGYVVFEDGTECVSVRIGSSFIDYEQAAFNLEEEIPANKSFEEITTSIKKVWNNNLGKLKVSEASDDDLAILYTAFFRTMQYPREFSEYGRYYSPFDDKIHNGVSYNAYSLWDTFRAQHPWLLLTQPERINDMITALIQMYKEGGWIPKWPNPTYTNIMIATHADAVIADAFINGYRDYDIETAYEAIRKDAFSPPHGRKEEQYKWFDRHLWNGCYEARGGLTNYLNHGYVAADKTAESVSRTLEFALDDYCIAQMAKKLGKRKDYETLMRRAANYSNLYNPQTGFFQTKNSDGNWGDSSNDKGYTEGDKWTYRFCVMQDPIGMIKLMGGSDEFLKRLDENFDDGHYRHDNEPGHHYVYLYNYCGRLDKTQTRIPGIIEKNYKNTPNGLSGNDDCGQMSAWYLFSSLGFYPVTPASGIYALGIPRFKEAELSLPNGKKLKIIAKDLKKSSILTHVTFNGRLLKTPFVSVREIMNGGTLMFSSDGK